MSRCSRLGASLVSHDYDGDQCSASSIVWGNLLDKSCRLSPIVYVASAALGAMYEACQTSTAFLGDSHSTAQVQYNIALALLRKDILVQSHGPLAILLASTILAGVEALQRNLTNALVLVRGGFKLYTESISGIAKTETDRDTRAMKEPEQLALSLLIQRLDLQNMTYKLSNGLDLPRSHVNYHESHTGSRFALQDRTESELVCLLHACYSFSSKASKYKYFPLSHVPPDMMLQQTQYVANLQKWLLQTPLQPSLLPFRIQCLSAITYLSLILSPYETTFDAFHHIFQQIVDLATTILSNRISSVDQPKFQFRLISSLSQPLFLTAMKCRHSELRRKAVALLSRTGREGPWDAEILVAVANRAVAIEEQWGGNLGSGEQEHGGHREDQTNFGGVPEERHDETMNTTPERARLHGCGMGYITTDSGSPVDGVIPKHGKESQRRTIEFRFRRCLDVEKMLVAHGDSSETSMEDVEHWEVWDEKIEL